MSSDRAKSSATEKDVLGKRGVAIKAKIGEYANISRTDVYIVITYIRRYYNNNCDALHTDAIYGGDDDLIIIIIIAVYGDTVSYRIITGEKWTAAAAAVVDAVVADSRKRQRRRRRR